MATSQKQIEANRRNAQKSTGPRTPEGRENSRANATTHGLTAAATIYRPIRHENPQHFQEVRAALFNDWQPVGTQEMLAVEMIAAAYRRIQRAEAIESATFDGAMEAMQMRHGKPLAPTKHDDLGCGIAIGAPQHKLSWENLDRYRRHAWLDYNRAVEQLRRLQKDRKAEPAREVREHNARERYLRRTHVGHGNRIPATKLASFRERLNHRARLSEMPQNPGVPEHQTPENPSSDPTQHE